jgi:hypothetical protein
MSPPVAQPEVASEGPSVSVPAPLIRILELKLLPEGRPGHPAEDTAALAIEKTSTPESIQIHTKLGLKDALATPENLKKDLYFSFPDRFYGVPVNMALYSHRVQKSPEAWQPAQNPWPASRDPEHPRFLIPFSKLYENQEGYSASSASLDHQQVLDVELFLRDGQSVAVRIQFQVAGALPVLERSEGEFAELRAREKASRAALGELEIHKESIKNPTPRELKLWLKASTNQLRLAHVFSFPVWSVVGVPEVVKTEQRISVGKLAVGWVDVVHEDQRKETVELDAQGWGSVTLKPNETLQLVWRASPAKQAQYCSIPEKVSQQRSWTTVHSSHPLHPRVIYFAGTHWGTRAWNGETLSEAVPIVIHYVKEVETEWTLSQVQLGGEWTREIRVAPAYMTQAQATGTEEYVAGAEVNSLQNFKRTHAATVSLELGELAAFEEVQSGKRANCQGFYP